MTELIQQMIDSYDITEKVSCITMDNTLANDKLAKVLAKLLHNNDKHMTAWKWQQH